MSMSDFLGVTTTNTTTTTTTTTITTTTNNTAGIANHGEDEWEWSGYFAIDSVATNTIPIYSKAGHRRFVQIEVRATGPSIFVLFTDLPHLDSNFGVPYRIDNQCVGTTVRFRQTHRGGSSTTPGGGGVGGVRRKWAVLRPFTSKIYAWDEPTATRVLDLEIGLVRSNVELLVPNTSRACYKAQATSSIHSAASSSLNSLISTLPPQDGPVAQEEAFQVMLAAKPDDILFQVRPATFSSRHLDCILKGGRRRHNTGFLL
jgi:hypothetical protein